MIDETNATPEQAEIQRLSRALVRIAERAAEEPGNERLDTIRRWACWTLMDPQTANGRDLPGIDSWRMENRALMKRLAAVDPQFSQNQKF